jgi:membrane-bound ClpP family serine protease
MVSNPNIAILLVALGTLGIYGELCRPGWVVPGVLGGVAFLVGFASLANAPAPVPWPFALAWLLPVLFLGGFLLKIAVRARRNKRSA